MSQQEGSGKVDKEGSQTAFEKADNLFDQGLHDEAIELYREAIELDPGNIPARHDLAHSYYCLGKDKEAVEIHRETLKIAPQNFHVLRSLGRSLVKLSGKQGGDDFFDTIEEAIETFHKLVELHPASPDSYVALGSGLLEINAPKNYGLERAHYNRAMEAKEACLNAIELGTKDPVAYLNAAACILDWGNNPQKAKELAMDGLSLAKGNKSNSQIELALQVINIADERLSHSIPTVKMH